MDQANSPADQLANAVFWIVIFTTAAFIAAVLMLVG
jgi:hypothetical protein